MHRGFCTDCGAYAALGENDRCAACDAWRHREEERRDHAGRSPSRPSQGSAGPTILNSGN